MFVFEPHPVVMWELTRLCDLRCRGCPSGASPSHDPNELTTFETYMTIDQIAALKPRELIITGGDPLLRPDIYETIDYARRRMLDPALVLTPTDELTFETLAKLAQSGLTRVVFSIDGATSRVHEAIHGVLDTFMLTLRAIHLARSAGLQVEVNTLVLRSNASDLNAIADLLRPLGIARWNVHFLVPVAASRELPMLTAAETEKTFEVIDAIRRRETFAVRVVEAPQFRRFRVRRILESRLADRGEWTDFSGFDDGDDDMRGLLDSALDGAHGFVYISHSGDVRPSEFAPHSAGNLRYRDLGAIYRASDLFVALRASDNLRGACGRCEYRLLCGGSRARAWAMTGDLFGADPLCAYEPPAGAVPAPVVLQKKEFST